MVALKPRCCPVLCQSEQSKGAWHWGFLAPCQQSPATPLPLMSSSVPAARAAESHVNSSECHFLLPADLALRLLQSQ